MKKVLALGLVFVFILFLLLLNLAWNKKSLPKLPVLEQAHLVGTFTTLSDPEISKNILDYLETKNSMYCYVKEYGHDEKYVFTWADCSSFSYMKANGDLSIESGFSMFIRFEYDRKSKKIVAHSDPEDGSNNWNSLVKLWPVELSLNPVRLTSNQSWFAKKRYIELKYPKVWEALNMVELQLAKYKNWEAQQSFAGKKLYFKEKDGEVLFNFVLEGSGVRVVEQNCIEVDKNGAVSVENSKICAGLGDGLQ